MRAKDVTSPIYRTRNHNVLFESPTSWDEEWSIVEAEVTEDPEEGEWVRSLGIRWDGDRDDPDSKGFPNSSGKGVWFWIPQNLAPFFYGMIIPQLLARKKQEAKDKSLKKNLKELIEKVEQLTAAQPRKQTA
jgi:hypothetical protein